MDEPTIISGVLVSSVSTHQRMAADSLLA